MRQRLAGASFFYDFQELARVFDNDLRLPVLRASVCTNSPPTPSAAAPASMNSAAVSKLTPPVGTSGTCGSGPFSALMYFAPPTLPQGNTLTKSDPAFQAVITSVGVNAPAIISTP